MAGKYVLLVKYGTGSHEEGQDDGCIKMQMKLVAIMLCAVGAAMREVDELCLPTMLLWMDASRSSYERSVIADMILIRRKTKNTLSASPIDRAISGRNNHP